MPAISHNLFSVAGMARSYNYGCRIESGMTVNRCARRTLQLAKDSSRVRHTHRHDAGIFSSRNLR